MFRQRNTKVHATATAATAATTATTTNDNDDYNSKYDTHVQTDPINFDSHFSELIRELGSSRILRVLLFIFNIHLLVVFCSIVYLHVIQLEFTPASYFEIALTPNLPFCEQPFAMTPYMAQGASALAHLPYIPLFLLGVSYNCPETIPSLAGTRGLEIRSFLWWQTGVQLFTSIGGHILPNPRIVINQEISILLAFVCLFKILKLTTPERASNLVNWKLFSIVAIISVGCYLTIGLMPVIFTCFAVSLSLGLCVRDAFGLITQRGNNVLLGTFIPAACVLLVETIGCQWLQTNISIMVPWHLLFDILFWQLVGTTIDLVIISPRPGQFLFHL
jgi:hypothetical protein